jgi:PAS domain S-box-containing protein
MSSAFHNLVLLDDARDATFLVDEQGRIVTANEAARQLYGLGKEPLAGRPLTEVFAVESPMRLEDLLREATVKGSWQGEAIHIAVNRRMTVEWSLRRAGEGKVLSVSRDITERKEAEAALRDSENHYRRLVEMSPDIVLKCDAEGRIVYVNLVGLELLGFDEHAQLVGRKLEEIVHPDSKADIRERLRKLFEGTSDLPFVEARFLRADGKAITVEMGGSIFPHRDDFVAQLVARDVTPRKKAEDAARRARRKLVIAALVTGLLIVSAGGLQVYQYTESVGFCGMRCHKVMAPELALHERSAHAHVTCSQCHIGPGARWYVKAKISGLHQVYAVMAETFPRPIPAPIVNLRPASETCEHCHAPQVFYGNRTRVFRRLPEDGNADDPEVTAVMLRVGGYRAETGRYGGIHWHASQKEKVEYRALDRRRLQIPELRVTRANGSTATYVAKGMPPVPAGTPWRTMDCCDCHNRTAHRYKTAEETVDDLILEGELRSRLPNLKQAALTALGAAYSSRDDARDGIRTRLASFYRQNDEETARLAKVLYEEAYAPNVYPQLQIKWSTYPDHVGHRDGLGCFRCHDGEHETADGKALAQDCDLCHSILVSGSRQSQIDPKVRALLFYK